MDEKSNRFEKSRCDFELLIPFAVLASIVLTDVVGVLAVVAGRRALILVPIVIAGFGLLAGAWLILAIVRRANRRNGPRHAKRPPDPP